MAEQRSRQREIQMWGEYVEYFTALRDDMQAQLRSYRHPRIPGDGKGRTAMNPVNATISGARDAGRVPPQART